MFFAGKIFRSFSVPFLLCFILPCLFLSGCRTYDVDHGLPSPCVGNEESPCEHRPINNFYV